MFGAPCTVAVSSATSTVAAAASSSSTPGGSRSSTATINLSSTVAPTSTSLPGTVIAPGTVVLQCSQPGTVALTFDDGPFLYTRPILDMLNAAGMKVVCAKLRQCCMHPLYRFIR